jgi:hypothetical protein
MIEGFVTSCHCAFLQQFGQCQDQVKEMKMVVQEWADQVWTGKLNLVESWFSLKPCILKKLEHPLTAGSFTKKDCNDIQKDFLKAGLPGVYLAPIIFRMRTHNEAPHGLQIPNIWTMQGVQNVWAARSHSTIAPSLVGLCVRTRLESIHLELGLPISNIFEEDYELLSPLVAHSWL